MKRRSAPTKLETAAPRIAVTPDAAGRAILFVSLLVCPLLFSQSAVEGFEFVKFLGLMLTALLLLVVGALALPRCTRANLTHELRQPLTLAAIAFVASAALSTWRSGSAHSSFYGYHENCAGLLTILGYFVLFAAARRLIQTSAQMRWMLGAILTGAALTSGYGLLQALHLEPFRWENVSSVGGRDRPFSTFGHANYLGAYLVLVLPLAAALTARGARPARIGLVLLATALVLLTILTLSRAAWLGLAVAALVLAVGYWLSRRSSLPASSRVIWIGVGTVTAILVVGLIALSHGWLGSAGQRLRHFFDDAGRGEIWSGAWAMFRERPLSGQGLDTFHHHFGRCGGTGYWTQFWGVTPTRAHNEFLHILATQGIAGALAACAVLVALCLGIVRAWQRNPAERGLVIAIATALAGFFITEMFGFTVIACGGVAVVLAAFVGRLGEQPNDVVKPVPAPVTIWPWRLVQAAAVVGCAFLWVNLVINPWRAEHLSREAELIFSKDADRALEIHESAVRLCPREPIYWNRLAACAEEAARESNDPERQRRLFKKARDGFAAAITREPGNGYHHSGLGRTLGELARDEGTPGHAAYAAFDTALALDPANAYFYVDASQAALRLGDADRAESYVNNGLQRYPNFGALKKQVAMTLLLRNRPYEALLAFEEAIWADWSGDAEGRAELVRARDEVLRRVRLMEIHQMSPGSAH
jgi:O-antigen ligase